MNIDMLYLLSNRDRWNKFEGVVNKNHHCLTKEANRIRRDMETWWENNAGDEIDWDKFSTWFCVIEHPSYSEDQLTLHRMLFKQLSEYTPTDHMHGDKTFCEKLIEAFTVKAIASELNIMSEEIVNGSERFDMSDVAKLVDDWEDTAVSTDTSFEVSADIDELIGAVLGEGWDWKQEWMNRSLGPVRKGDLIMLAKRPDSGGTSFLAGQANAFAHQMQDNQCVLWINNEQEGKKVKLRIIQEGINRSHEDILKSPTAAKELYEKQVGPLDRIKVIDKPGITYREVEAFCAQYSPSAIIIDQLWKIQGKGDISDVRCQTEIANWARELSKTYAAVIGVYQLDGVAEGMDYPGMERIYLSKTAVQGEADLILCLGRVYEQGKENIRYIHAPKNKMAGGGTMFNPACKQSKHESVFNPETGVFK